MVFQSHPDEIIHLTSRCTDERPCRICAPQPPSGLVGGFEWMHGVGYGPLDETDADTSPALTVEGPEVGDQALSRYDPPAGAAGVRDAGRKRD